MLFPLVYDTKMRTTEKANKVRNTKSLEEKSRGMGWIIFLGDRQAPGKTTNHALTTMIWPSLTVRKSMP